MNSLILFYIVCGVLVGIWPDFGKAPTPSPLPTPTPKPLIHHTRRTQQHHHPDPHLHHSHYPSHQHMAEPPPPSAPTTPSSVSTRFSFPQHVHSASAQAQIQASNAGNAGNAGNDAGSTGRPMSMYDLRTGVSPGHNNHLNHLNHLNHPGRSQQRFGSQFGEFGNDDWPSEILHPHDLPPPLPGTQKKQTTKRHTQQTIVLFCLYGICVCVCVCVCACVFNALLCQHDVRAVLLRDV